MKLEPMYWVNLRTSCTLQSTMVREDIKKKNCRFGENCTIGGERGSEKLLNFHHLQMMKNMEVGGGLRVTFHYFIEPNYD